jgi:molybdenum cofactor cytidylyltransferase
VKPPVVLVLASGRGERFVASGGVGLKLDALLAGKPVIERTLDAVRACALPWHLERADHAGMGDSIASAVAATRDAPGWLILPADLPLVQASTLQAVARALAQHSVVVPLYRGQRGHPVGFAANCRGALLQLQGAQGAAPIVRAQGAQGALLEIEIDDAGIVTDIDTLTDLANAEHVLAARGSTGNPVH